MLLRLSHLERTYDGQGGVRDVSIAIPSGAVYVLCGPNGAGKSTTLNVIAGLLFARDGTLEIDGRPVPLDAPTQRPGIGLIADTPFLDDELTGWQWAAFVTELKGSPWPENATRSAGLLRLQPDELATPIRRLSFGTRRKVALWVEFLTTDRLLLLDEPFIGLDPPSIDGMVTLAREFVTTGRSVLLSTHLLREVEVLATHVGFLDAGRMLAEGPISLTLNGESLQHAFLKRLEGVGTHS
jgi:ABC-2 type transport system ATP-binding protein